MSSIFTKIIRREEPGYIVWEDKEFIALLDINPIKPGHTLVIPKEEVDSIFDLSEEQYKKIWEIVKFLASPLQKATQAKRIGIAVEGFGVPHTHIHLVPVNNTCDLDPNKSKKATQEELETMHSQILNEIMNQKSLTSAFAHHTVKMIG
jgi:histidine triad (HIT) family protein